MVRYVIEKSGQSTGTIAGTKAAAGNALCPEAIERYRNLAQDCSISMHS